ncbi:DUF5809 family protein [Salinigranum rubrum]|uniref:DUF5809 family protein n=1 Tax=Salinigranum rubrum TaxID=755307 RepID=UPI001FE7665E|nr:DUF5809 family protein [Salinigranum rubrum]
MRTEGTLAPDTHEEAREAFEAAGPVAQRVVRETARAMAFDPEEYRERVTSDVVSTARDVLFASRLLIHSGTRAEFDEWCVDHDAFEVSEVGSPNVDRLVWHPAPFVDSVVAASYQDERDAAVEILRRQALGRIYRVELDAMEGAAVTDVVEGGSEGGPEIGTEDGSGDVDR